jgi:hypothetical protein
LATTTRGAFRASKLDERQVVHRFIGQTDLKIRAVRALLHERYEQLFEGVCAGKLPDVAAIADVRAAAVYATDIAIETATQVYHFAGNTGLHHPHVINRLLRDLNTAGLHQVMSDTAYENHGKVSQPVPSPRAVSPSQKNVRHFRALGVGQRVCGSHLAPFQFRDLRI